MSSVWQVAFSKADRRGGAVTGREHWAKLLPLGIGPLMHKLLRFMQANLACGRRGGSDAYFHAPRVSLQGA